MATTIYSLGLRLHVIWHTERRIASSPTVLQYCWLSVSEMSEAGEHHRNVGGIGSGDHLSVANGTPGLDDGCGPGFYSRFQPVGEGEERI